MPKDRHDSPEDQRRRLELKKALRELHEGPNSLPRKQVFSAIGLSEGLYSLWCNSEKPEACPNLMDIIAITRVVKSPVLLRCILDLSCDGFEIVATSGKGALQMGNGLRLLERIVTANSILEAGIARDLNDDRTPGEIDPGEARRRLPDAKEALRTHQHVVDLLEGIAGGRS